MQVFINIHLGETNVVKQTSCGIQTHQLPSLHPQWLVRWAGTAAIYDLSLSSVFLRTLLCWQNVNLIHDMLTVAAETQRSCIRN